MELSYTGLLDLYQTLTEDSSNEGRATASTYINLAYSSITKRNKWIFMEGEEDIELVAGVEKYQLPNNLHKVMTNPYTTIGTTKYPVSNITSREKYNVLSSNPTSASYPNIFFLSEDFVKIFPLPSTSGYKMTMAFQKKAKRLSVVDYITGTVTTLTNGSTAVVTAGATLTQLMVGRKIFFAEANGGDDQWYEIGAIAGNNITLKKEYQGVSVVTGTIPVKIGQVPLLPDGYQELCVYEAILLQTYQKELAKFNFIKVLRDELWKQLKADYSSSTTSTQIPDSGNGSMNYNPNNYLTM